MHLYPENPFFEEAEQFYYNKKYNLSSHIITQQHLCIVAPGRNLVNRGRYKKFIDSIASQDYDNYTLIYVDDKSIDNTP